MSPELTAMLERAQLAMDTMAAGRRANWKPVTELFARGIELAEKKQHAEARDALFPVYAFFATFTPYTIPRHWGFALSDGAPTLGLAAYLASPPEARARAVAEALAQLRAARIYDGEDFHFLRDVEELHGRRLAGRDAFLPGYIAELTKRVEAESDELTRAAWERDLDEALVLHGGTDALEARALATKSVGALAAWTLAAFRSGDAARTVAASEKAAAVQPASAGAFLDLGARAAQKLGPDVELRTLEAAWRAQPAEFRCLRWIVARPATREIIRERARTVLGVITGGGAPADDAMVVLLQLLAGDIDAASATVRQTSSITAFERAIIAATGGVPKLGPLGYWSAYHRDAYSEDTHTLAMDMDDRERKPTPRDASIHLALTQAGAMKLPANERRRILDALETALSERAPAVARTPRSEYVAPDPYNIATLVAACVVAERGLDRDTSEKTPAWVEAIHKRLSRAIATKSAALALRKQVNSVLRAAKPAAKQRR